MKSFHLAIAAVLLSGSLSAATAHSQAAIAPADQAAIDSTLKSFGTTLTAMDFDTFATLFTEDCDFVNIVGMHWSGRAQVEKAHRIVFTTRYRGVPQRIVEKDEALLAPGIVLVTSKIKMDDYTAQDGKRMTDNFFRMTWVLEKRGDRWLIRSAQNTSIDSEAAKHDPAHTP